MGIKIIGLFLSLSGYNVYSEDEVYKLFKSVKVENISHFIDNPNVTLFFRITNKNFTKVRSFYRILSLSKTDQLFKCIKLVVRN